MQTVTVTHKQITLENALATTLIERNMLLMTLSEQNNKLVEENKKLTAELADVKSPAPVTDALKK